MPANPGPPMTRTADVEQQAQSYVESGGAAAYITSGPELASHLRAPGRSVAYRALMQDLGVDTGIVPDDDARPALLFAEQPGCWFTARDLIRARILETLVTRGWFDWERSGVFALADDRFTGEGDKAVFLNFELCSALGTVRVLGSSFIRQNRRRTYSSLRLDGIALERMRTIFSASRRILHAATGDEEDFVDVVQEMRQKGLPDGLEPLLPSDGHAGRLTELCGALAEYDTSAAARLLSKAEDALRANDVQWEAFWNELNGRFLGVTVQRLGPLLNRLLLAVKDPVRMGQTLTTVLGSSAEEPVAVAGVTLGDDKYRMVCYHPDERAFLMKREGAWERVEWEEIRGVAMAGGAASPSGTLEYLLLAATGHYLIVDPGDGFHAFHGRACALHELYTGRKFPWITFPADRVDGEGRAGGPNGGNGHGGNSLVDAFHPRFARRSNEILKTFLTE